MMPNSRRSMRVPDLPRPRRPERVLAAVEVEARHLRELRRVVELGVGLAGEHRDPVPELGELAGEVARVDALAPAVGVAAVHEPGDAEGGVGGRHELGQSRRRPANRSNARPLRAVRGACAGSSSGSGVRELQEPEHRGERQAVGHLAPGDQVARPRRAAPTRRARTRPGRSGSPSWTAPSATKRWNRWSDRPFWVGTSRGGAAGPGANPSPRAPRGPRRLGESRPGRCGPRGPPSPRCR